MIPIFVPMKDGQVLMPEVMRGVLNQSLKCGIVPITSTCDQETRETNKVSNLLRALKINSNPYFIQMDSDVVLGNELMIEEMMMDHANMGKDIVLATTRKEVLNQCPYSPHSLMLLKGVQLIKFTDFLTDIKVDPEHDNKSNCSVCRFIFGKEDSCMYLQNEKNYEVERIDLTLNKFTAHGQDADHD